MKTTKLFRTAMQTALTLLLFVSCTSNEENTNGTQDLNKANRKGTNAYIPAVAKGKLIFENNTTFKLEPRLQALGGLDNVTADEKLQGLTVIKRNATTIFDDFKTVNFPEAEVLSWLTQNYGTYNGSDANVTFGLFLNDVDAQDGYYAKWDNFKMERFSGLVTSTIPNNNGDFETAAYSLPGMAIGLPQVEGEMAYQELPPSIPVFGGITPPQYLHFKCTTEVLANGDTLVVLNSYVDTTP